MKQTKAMIYVMALLQAILIGFAISMFLSVKAHADTLTVYNGRATRIIDNERAHAWGFSDTIGNWRIGYHNEGHFHVNDDIAMGSKRDGIFSLYHMERGFYGPISFSAEVGPYMSGNTITDISNHGHIEYRLLVMGGLGVHARLSKDLSVGFTWLHVMPQRPTDNFLIGIEFRNSSMFN